MFIIVGVNPWPLAPSDSLVRIKFHFSFQKRIIEMKNEIKFPIMNLFIIAGNALQGLTVMNF